MDKGSWNGGWKDKRVLGTIIVAALGYFVDIYDLLIFSILRVPSLKSLGVPTEQLLSQGLFLLNMQMGGMLIGGVIWGVIGDKRGRLSVLLGSIFMYSVANIANGFVTTISAYGALRFIAGLGLAGELGAGITLVSELMSKESRGYGTTIVATVGVAGAVFGALIGEHFSWQQCYFIGGGLGLSLLFLRVAVNESGLFNSMKNRSDIKRGDLIQLVSDRKRLAKYARCILVGLPIWFVIGILITFAPEFAKAFGVAQPVSAGRAVMFSYSGLIFGDFTCGIFSQLMKSRKKVLFLFLVLTAVTMLLYLYGHPTTASGLYLLCLPVGYAVGYWSVFVTNAAEQFGTNLRATVTTTAPNFVRGAVVPITALFQFLRYNQDIVTSALIVGSISLVIAFLSLWGLEESFGKDLNYVD